MTTAHSMGTPLPIGSTIIPGTLRAKMQELRGLGTVLELKEAVGIVVPLTVQIAERHRAGEVFYVHPSSIITDAENRWQLSANLARTPPTLPRDKACMAPESRTGQPSGSRGSVFALGAILYELVTGETVGPGMRRPADVVPTLPQTLEMVLSKALVADPAHRPDDLLALAQAVHHLAPEGSLAPPPADESHLDRDGDFAVDVSMSLMPPAPTIRRVEAQSPYDVVVRERARAPVRKDDITNELTALKVRLESDPRPRYVVTKDGMDHGPFSAVELLQQIASHTFVDADLLFDNLTKQERSIKDWEEFAPFAEHARIHRTIKAEKEAIERVVVQERKSTASKALLGLLVVGGLVAVAALWFLARRGARSDRIAVQEDKVSNVESDAGLNVPKKPGAGRGGVIGTSGGYPVVGGGTSCEAAVAAYSEQYNIGSDKKVPADLTANQYGAVLNRGTYLLPCGVPPSMRVSICAAVQNGRAVGVTVTTSPNNPGVGSCVAGQVRGMSFPSHPRLDVTRTTFE
jgi:eukaryotic-like serine/threonine-protein kinase